MNKTITVIATVFNKEKYLERAIYSVLCQSVKPSQLIIVDDHSTDGSIEILNKIWYKIKQSIPISEIIFSPTNQGAAAARNLALKRATSDYILFIDTDDFYHSNYLECLTRLITSQPGLISSAVLMESQKIKYPSDRVLNTLKHIDNNLYVVDKPFLSLSKGSLFIGGGNLCFRRDLMPQSLVDIKERNFEEWDFYYSILLNAISQKLDFLYNDEIGYYYNDKDDMSLSRKNADSYHEFKIPKIIARLVDPVELKYKKYLLSMWLYNCVTRLSNNKDRILFLLKFKTEFINSTINTYFCGTILWTIFPNKLLIELIKIVKRNKYKR